MARCMFSILIENSENQTKSTLLYKEHKDLLIEKHKQYSMKINADYKLFSDDDFYGFRERYSKYDCFDVINYFKFYIFEILASDYDEILFIDFDILPNTNEDIFYQLKDDIALVYRDIDDHEGISKHSYDKELAELWWDPEIWLRCNSSVILMKKETPRKLNYFKYVEWSDIDLKFIHNNEVFLGRAITGENIKPNRLDSEWSKCDVNAKFMHFNMKSKMKDMIDEYQSTNAEN